jgi:hypothetical protein
MRYLLAQGIHALYRIGPGTALSGFMKRIKTAQMLTVADLPSLETTAKALGA